ncbi:hypothetical protein [Vallitalea maricola]|uniref:Uncharacterized protein n=1 Tax=Vallitalea maricola TaxID=3074433 RepID=A0ACB5UH59_9FIRM|nr:hypothetical protein AN2V17_13170 [Vallitalea sp. AN17-2]
MPINITDNFIILKKKELSNALDLPKQKTITINTTSNAFSGLIAFNVLSLSINLLSPSWGFYP